MKAHPVCRYITLALCLVFSSVCSAESALVAGKSMDLARVVSHVPSGASSSWKFQFMTPDSISGMHYDNGDLLMVSEQIATLFVIDPRDGSIKRRLDLPGSWSSDPGSWGITVINGNYWHSDYQENTLYVIDPVTGSVLDQFPMGTIGYLGIAWDGVDLWGVNPRSKRLIRIDISDGSVIETVPIKGINAESWPIGLTWDGYSLWISDMAEDVMYQISRDGTVLRTEPTLSEPTGIAAQLPRYILIGVQDACYRKFMDIGISTSIDIPPYLHPGDPFYINQNLNNLSEPMSAIPVFFIFKMYSCYWFWPSWSYWTPAGAGTIDYRIMDVPAGTTVIPIIPEVVWPDLGDDSLNNLQVIGGMLDPDMTDLIGNTSIVNWGFGP